MGKYRASLFWALIMTCVLVLSLCCIPAMAQTTLPDESLRPYLWFCKGEEKPDGLVLGSGLIVYDMRTQSFVNDLAPAESRPESVNDVRAVVLVEEGPTSFVGQYSNGWTNAGIHTLDVSLYSVKTGIRYATENILGSDPPETTTITTEAWVYGDWPTQEQLAQTVSTLSQQLEDAAMETDEASPWLYSTYTEENAADCLSEYGYTEAEALAFIPKDPGVVINGYQGYSNGGRLVIPSELDGQPVVAIGNAAFYNSTLTEIILPDTLTRIGEEAFRDCAITTLALPEGITVLPYGALLCCRLQTLTLPNSLKAIAYDAFGSSMELQTLTLPEGLSFIGSCAFEGCQSLAELTLPNSVAAIGDLAFSDCPSLTIKAKKGSYAQWYLEEGAAKRNDELKEQGLVNEIPPFEIIP